jgi:hypothetical protein
MASSARKRLIPPAPPADFANIPLPLESPRGRTFYRITNSSHPSPLFFSKAGFYRFDSPSAKWGVCYLADRVETAALEVFGDAFRKRSLDHSELAGKTVWRITVPADLQLLALRGEVLPRIKATLQSFVSRYSLSQEWGRVFMTHPIEMDGVLYAGRQSGGSCLALFGDNNPSDGRWHQVDTTAKDLGRLTQWDHFYSFLEKANVRLRGMPSVCPSEGWSQ